MIDRIRQRLAAWREHRALQREKKREMMRMFKELDSDQQKAIVTKARRLALTDWRNRWIAKLRRWWAMFDQGDRRVTPEDHQTQEREQ